MLGDLESHSKNVSGMLKFCGNTVSAYNVTIPYECSVDFTA